MRIDEHQKVTASHLKRNAYLYIRQSTLRQVMENTESTQRQYALRERAVALGWPVESVVTIDSDLGHSGASTVDREGFQGLVKEVGLGKAGIVMGLEVSRLARNSADWHRLLEICAVTDTLILDEDGLYDPKHFNDRLVLGMKGTMSEAELHILKGRLRGGILSKAKRGELKMPLPVGFVHDERDNVILDPDIQVQEAIRLLFRTFARTGSAYATVKAFRNEKVLFPRRLKKGPHKGDLVWAELVHHRVLQVLHNPRYAGAFCFGRTRCWKNADGQTMVKNMPRDEWPALFPDAHAGYISWQEYEDNQRRLIELAQAHGKDRYKSPPREGPALLQGLVMCGICGGRMGIHYHIKNRQVVPEYVCQRAGIEQAQRFCQRMMGDGVDEAIGELLMDSMKPMVLEVALAVQQELQSRIDEADRLRHKQVERARYESELARRRYMQVDPDNRLVADALEAEWNEKLKALTGAQEEYERAREADRVTVGDEQRKQIMALTTDFPRLWQNPKTPQRERKRMIRLLIEDVTLIRGSQITAHVRFKGGATRTLTLPVSLGAAEMRKAKPELVQEVNRLIDDYTDSQIARVLRDRGTLSPTGLPFTAVRVAFLRYTYKLKPRYDRLREKGLLTLEEMAQALDISTCTVKIWRNWGLLTAYYYNDRNDCLYEFNPDNRPEKFKHKKTKVPSNPMKGVQYEA
ncbi:MAG: recombinase family protein [Armatimonadota bacterium]